MFKKAISIILCVIMVVSVFPFSFFAVATEEKIPEDAFQFQGHCYKVYKGVCGTWDAAKLYCENLGGYLAIISSEEENEALYNYITSSGVVTAYFGFSDYEKNGEWTWVNGENNEYTNWQEGEPNGGTSEYYAEFYYKFGDGTWNDGNFDAGTQDDEKNFICEWDLSEPVEKTYPQTHGWCVSNSKESFGYGDNYRIPLSQYYKVYGISLSTLVDSTLHYIPEWGGNCFGLSFLSLAQYYGLTDLSEIFSKSGDCLYDFGYETIAKTSNGREYFSVAENEQAVSAVERALISQDSADFKKCEILKNDSDFQKLIDYLSSDDAKPILATISAVPPGKLLPVGHAVVLTTDIKPTKLEGENSDWYAIPLYDPNAPAPSDLLEKPASSYERGDSWLLVNPKKSEWQYHCNGKIQWNNTYNSIDVFSFVNNIKGQSIRYYDISLMDSEYFTETLSLWCYKIHFNIFTSNIEIHDKDGNVLLRIENGKVTEIADGCQIQLRFNDNEEAEPSYSFSTDCSDFTMTSDAGSVVISDKDSVVAVDLNESYQVNVGFYSKQIDVLSKTSVGAFEVCAQNEYNRAIKVKGNNVEGNVVSLKLSDDSATIQTNSDEASVSYEVENLDADNVEIVKNGVVTDEGSEKNSIPMEWVILALLVVAATLIIVIIVMTRPKKPKKKNQQMM